MPTSVTITGTGTPIATPDRAGPGVLVSHDDVAVQFDAGRGTVMRLAAASQPLMALDALFVTHHHSDHIVGIPDLVMTRWLDDIKREGQPPLSIFCPSGEAAHIIEHMLDVWQNEMAMRSEHTGRPNIAEIDVRMFQATSESPIAVAQFGDVSVSAIAVEHEPVVPAVAFRVDTPDGSVVISGDTAVCRQVEELCEGSDLLVHEAIRRHGLDGRLSAPDKLLAYHSECSEIGAMAQRAGVGRLVLTHLVPPPKTPAEKEAFARDVRRGGYDGEVVVADDLTAVAIA